MATRRKTPIIYKDKVVSYLKTFEGDSKVKVYDKEQKQKVETGGIRHWRRQEFSMALDKGCGYAPVEYWGATTLQEGSVIEISLFHLKQKKWTTKDPKTFKEIKHSSLILILDEISNLKEEPKQEQTEELVSVDEEMTSFQAENEEEPIAIPEL